MRCIFCKKHSTNTKSIEHIIPQSLGNTEHILPRGTVCDACNNYFSVKIEKPILSSGIFQYLRNERELKNKRGKIPKYDNDKVNEMPDYRIFTRFIGKIGLEVLAFKTCQVNNWNQEIVEKTELDELRNYVRLNQGSLWPMFYRTLYPVDTIFREGNESFEVLHEFDLLYTDSFELYIVVVILGVEFVMNLGDPKIDGYERWFNDNQQKSFFIFRKK